MTHPELRDRRRGMALLEVLVALAILGGAGLGTVLVLRQASRAEAAAAREEHRLAQADRLLAAHTLLAANELDQRLGGHEAGEFEVRIARPEAGLYRIAILDREDTARELLVTVVSRGVPGSAP